MCRARANANYISRGESMNQPRTFRPFPPFLFLKPSLSWIASLKVYSSMENNQPNTDHGEQPPDAGLARPPSWYSFSPTDRQIMAFLEMKIQNQVLPMNDIVDTNVFSENETPEGLAGNNSQKPLFLNFSFTERSSVYYFVCSIVKIQEPVK